MTHQQKPKGYLAITGVPRLLASIRMTLYRTIDGCLAITGVLFLLVVLPVVLLLGWAGFVPGLSDLMGTREVQDLGVTYQTADLRSLEQKTGITVQRPVVSQDASAQPTPSAPSPKPRFENPRQLDTTITQEELSAVVNSSGLLPLRDAQIRLTEGAAELSGVLDTARFEDFLRTLKVKEANIDKIAGMVKAMGDNVPLYLKASGSVQDAQVDVQWQSLRLGNLDIPQEQLSRIAHGGVHTRLRGNENFSIQTLTLHEGSLNFAGILPTLLNPSGE